MEAISTQIWRYIDFLKASCGLRVTVHGVEHSVLSESMGKLAPYNIHSCSYCLQMKSNADIWKSCIEKQKNVTEKLREGEFFGMCYLGVCEYVYPIECDSKIYGFICVSGYRSDSEKALAKIKRASIRFGLNYETVKSAYFRELNDTVPPKREVDTLIAPLISLLKEFCTEEEKATKNRLSGNSYVYGHILEYINRNFAIKRISVAEIAELCHCSESHISHVFAKYCGMGVAEYTNSLRVSCAKEFLTSTDMRIQEISDAVGFSDSNYFSNVFRKAVGISPREYRKLYSAK